MQEFNVEKIRKEFAFLNKVGKKIIYFDSAATSQKPKIVIDAISDYYKFSNANPGRSSHFLGIKSSKFLDESRETVARYLNADKEEIIFTRSSTDGINMVAGTWGIENLKRAMK